MDKVKMHKTDIKKLINYNTQGPYKNIFYEQSNIKAQVVCLKSRQIIPPCKMSNDVLFYIIEGKGEIIVDNKKEKIKPMISIIVPKNAKSRSILAKTDMVILAIQCKTK